MTLPVIRPDIPHGMSDVQTKYVMKTCSKCKRKLPLAEFNAKKAAKDGHTTTCKECCRQVVSEWYQRNKTERSSKRKEWYLENADKEKQRVHEWYNENKEYVKISSKRWRDRNPNWRSRCDPERIKSSRQKFQQKIRNDPKQRIRHSFSSQIRRMLKGKKDKSTLQILDYTLQQLKDHLESLFTEGMIWENYGFGRDKWTIDHKIPVSAFTYETYECEGFRQCWALSNLQPMWYIDNCKKGNKI